MVFEPTYSSDIDILLNKFQQSKHLISKVSAGTQENPQQSHCKTFVML